MSLKIYNINMEAFDDLVTVQGQVQLDPQDFEDHVRAEEDRKARVLSSIQTAMRERLDNNAIPEFNLESIEDNRSTHPPEDIRGQLFEGIPDPYPHSTKFQRVIISESGEDVDNDTVKSCRLLNTCMGLREKWLAETSPTSKKVDEVEVHDGDKRFRRRPGSLYNIFDRKVPDSSQDYSYMMVRGVFEVRRIGFGDGDNGGDCVALPFDDFIEDFITVSVAL